MTAPHSATPTSPQERALLCFHTGNATAACWTDLKVLAWIESDESLQTGFGTLQLPPAIAQLLVDGREDDDVLVDDVRRTVESGIPVIHGRTVYDKALGILELSTPFLSREEAMTYGVSQGWHAVREYQGPLG